MDVLPVQTTKDVVDLELALRREGIDTYSLKTQLECNGYDKQDRKLTNYEYDDIRRYLPPNVYMRERRANEKIPEPTYSSFLEKLAKEPVKIRMTAVDRDYYVPLVSGLLEELSTASRRRMSSQLTSVFADFYGSFEAIKVVEGTTEYSDIIDVFLVSNGWDGRQFEQAPNVGVLISELTAVSQNVA